MRVSVIKSDPGFVEDAHNYRVLFNGQDLIGKLLVLTADEEAGMIQFYVHDRSGQCIYFEDEILHAQAFGTVKLVRTGDCPHAP